MAEVIQFSCPACGTMLRLPLAMAGQHGPCPTCRREIVAPDPYRGLAAFEAPFAYIPAVPPPFRPFSDSPPFVPGPPEIASPFNQPAPLHAPEPSPSCPPPPAPTASPLPAAPTLHKPLLVCSCLVSFAVALGLGYYLGFRTTEKMLRQPDPASVAATTPKPSPTETRGEPIPLYVKPVIEKPVEPPPAETPPPAAEAAPTKPTPETPPEALPAPAPRTVSAAAEASLRAFLEAPDWATRNAHVLRPAAVRAEMEAYSRTTPDGPTTFRTIEVKHSEIDPPTGNTLFIFQITTDEHPDGFPVAVAETPQGWLTDWQTFVEFRDDQFKKFAAGATDLSGRFHLLVSRPPASRAAKTENEHFAPFLLDPPFPGRQQLAYVKKSSAAYQTIQAAIAEAGTFTPVLEVARRSTPEGKPYLEILNVVATDWRPVMDSPATPPAP